MKIAFFEVEEWEEKIIKVKFSNDDVFVSADKVTPTHLIGPSDYEIISVFVNSVINKETLTYFPNVKLITTRSTGYDHIDIDECKKRGIAVAYVPGYGNSTVAEFTFGLLLSLTRKIYQGIDQIKETGSFSLENLRGTDIKGKIFGVVGAGRIGREVIHIAKGFGMEVIAYDPFPNKEVATTLGFRYVSFEELLKTSDVISLHVPYTKETHHLINSENIASIKRGAYLINTARGAIVETNALVDALTQGILAGVGMDVLEEEGDMKDELNLLRVGHPKEEELKRMLQNHMLMHMPNVLITPHAAFNSIEALLRILTTTIETIQSFSKNTPVNLVP